MNLLGRMDGRSLSGILPGNPLERVASERIEVTRSPLFCRLVGLRCDAHDGRIAWLRTHYPKQYRALRTAFPRVGVLA